MSLHPPRRRYVSFTPKGVALLRLIAAGIPWETAEEYVDREFSADGQKLDVATRVEAPATDPVDAFAEKSVQDLAENQAAAAAEVHAQ
jgi:hypothetical protein